MVYIKSLALTPSESSNADSRLGILHKCVSSLTVWSDKHRNAVWQ